MSGRRFSCSDELYVALQMARQHLISTKILRRELERDADRLRGLGLHEDAMKYQEVASRLIKDIRFWEDEVGRLEKEKVEVL